MTHTINHKRRYNARKLKGAGLKDLFSKVKNTVSNVVGKVAAIPTNIINNILPEQQKYTKKAKTMIDRYGGFKIEHLFVERQEVNSAVMKLASVLTVGEMNDAMQKSGVDKFYHLNLKAIITSALGTPLHILIEKNDTINIDLWKQRANVETMEIDLLGKVLTITEMLTKTRLAIGNEKFFLYRALEGKNCGDFCEDVVKSNGLWQDKYTKFMIQNTSGMRQHISQNSQNRLNMLTKLGAVVSHIKGGKLDTEVRFI